MTTNKIVILISILFVYSCSTNEPDNETKRTSQDTIKKTVKVVKSDSIVKYNVTINDTFFIRRAFKPYVDFVFIDKNRNNDFYKELKHKDVVDISFIYEYFNSPLKKVSTNLLPDRWIELIKYQNEFYVNRPSNDSYNVNEFELNDSLYLSCFSDPFIRPLKSLRKKCNNKFELTVFNVYGDYKEKTEEKINIYLIDNKRQIYLFENYGIKENLYFFATPINNIQAFDLLNIYSENNHFQVFKKTQLTLKN